MEIKTPNGTPQDLNRSWKGRPPQLVSEAGNGAVEQRRQGRHRSSPSPRTNREEVRATRSSNPQPRTDPMSEDLETHAEGCTGKRR